MIASSRAGGWIRILVAVVAGNLLGLGVAHAQNVAPVISGTPPTTARDGSAYAFQPTASDANGDRISFGATNVPRWARFDRKTGRLYGSPARRDVGVSSTIKISVSDGKLITALPAFTVVVIAAGSAPWISGAPSASAKENALYGFLPASGDPDGDTLTFSIANKPAWATFTSSSGLLSGIPPTGAAGTYANILISVSDGQNSRSLPAFSVVVAKAANSPPVIYGLPAASVQAGKSYGFVPNASDPDGQKLTFSIQKLPIWAKFDTVSGALSGTPSNAQAGVYSSIVISASDAQATSSLAAFSITVSATNTPPKISGTPPASATVGQAYSFIPVTSDSDGQKLTFSIANRPSWAQFDSTTGRLYGTPAAAHVGSTSGISISVNDGVDSASLATFSVLVSATAVRSAALSWLPPTSNVDGTPVTNLAGYRVAYGQSASNLSQSLSIPHPEVTAAVIENLTTGTWYFAVKAYTTTNVESDLSNLAQKTLN